MKVDGASDLSSDRCEGPKQFRVGTEGGDFTTNTGYNDPRSRFANQFPSANRRDRNIDFDTTRLLWHRQDRDRRTLQYRKAALLPSREWQLCQYLGRTRVLDMLQKDGRQASLVDDVPGQFSESGGFDKRCRHTRQGGLLKQVFDGRQNGMGRTRYPINPSWKGIRLRQCLGQRGHYGLVTATVANYHQPETRAGGTENIPHPDVLLSQFVGRVLQFNRLEVSMQFGQEWPARLTQTTFRALRVVDGGGRHACTLAGRHQLVSQCGRCLDQLIEIGCEDAGDTAGRQKRRKYAVGKGRRTHRDRFLYVDTAIFRSRIYRFKGPGVLCRVVRCWQLRTRVEEQVDALLPQWIVGIHFT
ncbi:hypothetical protein D9M70_247850 [compost metagenome]